MAVAALESDLSGRVESEFILDLGEVDGVKTVLAESATGVWKTPDSAHLRVTISRQGPPTVEIDGRTIETPDFSMTQEVIFMGEDVYVMASPPLSEARYEGWRDDWNDRNFDLFVFFNYYRLLDFDGEISVVEQELNGELVYYITGPIAIHRAYPVIGPSALDGVLQYWIGAEDYLLRRFEVSGVGSRGGKTQRLNGFITLSDFGEPVDIQRPVHEGADDHGNSPSTATEVLVGEPVAATSVDSWFDTYAYSPVLPSELEEGQQPITGTVDSWLDYDYFRFQAKEGQRYVIAASHERIAASHERTEVSFGIRTTLYGPDGVTPESTLREWLHYWVGSMIEWEASASGTYYLRVERAYSGTVPYTLTVTPVE